jgi:putative lipoic acid-binding regulatory protein
MIGKVRQGHNGWYGIRGDEECLLGPKHLRLDSKPLACYSLSMIQQRNTSPAPQLQGEVEYPALFHFRIITDTDAQAEQSLLQAVKSFQVTDPLVSARASSAGHYTAFAVSITMQSRTEMEAFDAVIKKVPGVRMVL